MRLIYKFLSVALAAPGLVLSIAPQAEAHLMVAQHGTLNFVDDSAFMVLSLPVSAFEGIDDNHDGAVSMIELNNHRAAIVDAVRKNVMLGDNSGNRPLQGLTLSPVAPHDPTRDAAVEAITQLIVIGRFTVAGTNSAQRFQVGLYGKEAAERTLQVTATRRSDNRRQVLELTPGVSAGLLFADSH